MKVAGVSLVFRSTEFGEVERPDSGEPTFHVHAHAIVHLTRKLTKKDWERLLTEVRAFWKHHFSDSKRIHQARETCKYVVKPSDLEELTSAELACLYHQTFRLHLVQSLGLLRELQKEIKEGRKRIIRSGKGGVSRWELVDAWDPRRSKQEGKDIEEKERNVRAVTDWIICTLPPSFALSARAEPVAVVLNLTGNYFVKNRKVRAVQQYCSEQFVRGLAKSGVAASP